MDISKNPARKVALPFAGDDFAQIGAQVEITASASNRAIRCTGGPLRFHCVAYDGVGPSAAPVDGDASTVDMVVVKAWTDRRGNHHLSRCATLRETEGAEVAVGEDLTEDDVSQGDVVHLGFVTATQDGAAAIWVWVDSGGVLVS